MLRVPFFCSPSSRNASRLSALLAFLIAFVASPVSWSSDAADPGSGATTAQLEDTIAEEDAPQAEDRDVEADTIPLDDLRVAVRVAPPFVIEGEDGELHGLSISLWEHIADQLDLDYQYETMSLADLLEAVEVGDADVGVAALTITPEREHVMDFTHPFYVTGTGIATRYTEQPLALVLFETLFSWGFLRAVLGLCLLLLLVGAGVFFFERRKNEEEFGGSALNGLGSAFWWSAVTMTTVGYGDKSPRTPGGRLIALVWMFASITLISVFTASIASQLTFNRMQTSIQGPADLPRASVGALEASSTAAWLDDERIRHRTFSSIVDGLDAVDSEEIDAFLHDAPILQYQLVEQRSDRVAVLPRTFNRQYYALGLPADSPLRSALNAELIEFITSEEWSRLQSHYLGENGS